MDVACPKCENYCQGACYLPLPATYVGNREGWLYATFRRGSHDDLTRVHRVPPVSEGGHSDFAPAVCGAVPATHGWAPVLAAPPAGSRPPRGYRCPACFEEV